MTYNVIWLNVNEHSKEENQASADKAGVEQITVGVHLEGRNIKDPTPLHKGVQGVENDSHQDDADWHSAFPFDKEGKDEGSLEVMKLEKQEEYQAAETVFSLGKEPEQEHRDENRRLHQYPAQLVIQGGSPLFIIKFAVTGIDKMQRYENHQGDSAHY